MEPPTRPAAMPAAIRPPRASAVWGAMAETARVATAANAINVFFMGHLFIGQGARIKRSVAAKVPYCGGMINERTRHIWRRITADYGHFLRCTIRRLALIQPARQRRRAR